MSVPGFTAEECLQTRETYVILGRPTSMSSGLVGAAVCNEDCITENCSFDCFELMLPRAACLRAKSLCIRNCCSGHPF